ncbi:hypothetical protein ANN_07615 [Periplaneta americana]|uniref:Uncharacterized protein n=1 Tax=Periplaneta americana TaxID=6978 RepID=A0ABQ8T0C6_PERAM|nr:hypothetical protein ANN_07615 [Periplaneta americana]
MLWIEFGVAQWSERLVIKSLQNSEGIINIAPLCASKHSSYMSKVIQKYSKVLQHLTISLPGYRGSLEEARMESGAHQGGAGMPPGSLYNSTGGGAPRSNSSSSSASPPASAPTPSAAAAMLVVPQPINASKMSGQQQGSIVSANGGTGRKYQCKMCPQSNVWMQDVMQISLKGALLQEFHLDGKHFYLEYRIDSRRST